MNQDFLGFVREYLPLEARIRTLDLQGRPSADASPAMLNENTFYLLEGEAASAFSNAVEEAALEEGRGRLLAAVQEFRTFEPLRERYAHLAATIQAVEVVGTGASPRRIPHVKFVRDAHGRGKGFRLALYEGPRAQVLFAARQTQRGPSLEERQFLGFYTFDPRVAARMRADWQEMLAGRNQALREFERQEAIGTAARQIESDFLRGKEALETAMRRLQSEGVERMEDGEWRMELEKGLAGLSQWKERMPRMLAQVPQWRDS